MRRRISSLLTDIRSELKYITGFEIRRNLTLDFVLTMRESKAYVKVKKLAVKISHSCITLAFGFNLKTT